MFSSRRDIFSRIALRLHRVQFYFNLIDAHFHIRLQYVHEPQLTASNPRIGFIEPFPLSCFDSEFRPTRKPEINKSNVIMHAHNVAVRGYQISWLRLKNSFQLKTFST